MGVPPVEATGGTPVLLCAGPIFSKPFTQLIVKEFIRASAGEAKLEFWRNFFNWGEASGGHGISGWINQVFRGKDSELDQSFGALLFDFRS
jgi:hypothetical protein